MGSGQSNDTRRPADKSFGNEFREADRSLDSRDDRPPRSNAAGSSSQESTTKISYHDDKRHELTGMAKVNYVCRKRNKVYQDCVAQWYNKEFLGGKSMHQSDVCGDKFEAYRVCVLKGIKKEIWDKQSLPPPKEGSPLAEVMEEHEIDHSEA